jgi:hypothetical protein
MPRPIIAKGDTTMADVSTQKTEGAKKEGGIRKEILIAIFVGFLTTILFDPLTKLIWNWILEMGRLGYTGVVNSVYRQAAYGHRNDIDVVFLELIWMAGFVFVIWAILMTFRGPKGISDLTLKAPTKIRLSWLKTIVIVSSAIMVISFSFGFFGSFADLQLNTSFQQRLTALAPVITDQQEEELQASWASMENRDDYLVILERMNSMAKDNGIELPKPLLK